MPRIINLLLWVSALSSMAFGSGSFNRDEYSRTFDKTINVQSGEVVAIEHKFGDINVHTHPGQDVVIHAEIHVSASDSNEAKRYADLVEIQVEPSSELLIRTRYPEIPKSFFGMHNVSFSVHYELTIPESSPLHLRNAFGAVFVTGLKTSSDILTSHGELKFHDGRGTQRLENSFAGIELDHNIGDVSVETTNGSVNASDITGGLAIRDRFAKITVTRVSNAVSISNGNGAVEVNDCGGEAEIKTSFAPVSVRNLHGDLTVNDNNGKVEVTEIGGAANVHTSFGEVTFSGIAGLLSIRSNNGAVTGNKVGASLTVVNSFGAVQVSDIQKDVHIESQNGEVNIDKAGGPTDVKTSFGAVHATNIRGALTVHDNNGSVQASHVQGARIATSFGAVILEGVAGPVEVQNQNGAVEVASELRGSCQPVAIRTSFGPIQVRIQPDASYRVSAHTSLGKIHSDFPLTIQGSLSNDEINGTIGTGRCEMNLVDQNAVIEILKR